MSECHTVAPVAAPPYAATGRRLVAIIGPPNSGKSTLFNLLTGLRQKVANYPGVTVERHVGKAILGDHREVDLLDLPGVYSLEPRSEDERVTHDVLDGRMPDLPRPDAVLLIVDSTNLARNLVLVAPVLSLGIPAMLILNMADDLRNRGGTVNTSELSEELGVPVALISASRGEGVEMVREFLRNRVAPPPRMELPVLSDVPACRKWATGVSDRAGYRPPVPAEWTRRLDSILLHKLWGPLVFALVVLAVFETIFTAAVPMMDAVDALIQSSGNWLGSLLPEGLARSFVVDGVWSGVGSVVVFLPQILLLFLFIGIMEDSGYMARAAVIADRTMARAGLQGKAFIPLLSAYACAVPAILSTRTIESKRDRIATILIAPFMTCSARLPVFTLVIAAFVADRTILGPVLHARTAAMLGLYALGFIAAVATARILKSSVLKSERSVFLLEMPPYRWPTFRSLSLRLLDRAKIFLKRAGTIILAVTILLWAMASLPLQDGQAAPLEQSYAADVGKFFEPVLKPLGLNWKIGIGLITSLAAREVIVGTLGTIYGIQDAESDEPNPGLMEALRQDLSPGGAAALLIFFVFALQCMSTVAVVRRETGGWKWPLVQFSYMLALAYIGGFIAYRVLS